MKIRYWFMQWRWRFEDWCEDRAFRRRQQRCRHVWRPTFDLQKRVLARYCQQCEAIEVLTHEAYYAQFGERGWGLLGGQLGRIKNGTNA